MHRGSIRKDISSLGAKLTYPCTIPRQNYISTIRNTSAVRIQASVLEKDSPKLQTGTWSWECGDSVLKINYEEHAGTNSGPIQNILFLPTISDVSTTDEWRRVAQILVSRQGSRNWRAVIVDWPGLGFSDRPPIEYTADLLEKFLVDWVTATDGPFGISGNLWQQRKEETEE